MTDSTHRRFAQFSQLGPAWAELRGDMLDMAAKLEAEDWRCTVVESGHVKVTERDGTLTFIVLSPDNHFERIEADLGTAIDRFEIYAVEGESVVYLVFALFHTDAQEAALVPAFYHRDQLPEEGIETDEVTLLIRTVADDSLQYSLENGRSMLV